MYYYYMCLVNRTTDNSLQIATDGFHPTFACTVQFFHSAEPLRQVVKHIFYVL